MGDHSKDYAESFFIIWIIIGILASADDDRQLFVVEIFLVYYEIRVVCLV